MLKKLLAIIGVLLLVLIAIVLVKTILFSKEIPVKQSLAVPALPDSAVVHMQEAVRIKTVSYGYDLPIDTAAFLRFRAFLESAYPLVHQKLQKQSFNQFSYLFKWEGKNPQLKPFVLMAHMDVVPVEPSSEKLWSVDPFAGTLRHDTIYGRGVVDDKASLIGVLEATESLLKEGYQPERTIYLSFGHDEELSGHRGAQTIAAWFKQQKIHPEVVMDEGGEITREYFSSLKRPIALISIAEKGYMSFELSVKKDGGHSSMPDKETAIDILVHALYKLREKQMPYRITPAVKAFFEKIGPGLPFVQRMAIANQWLLEKPMVSELEKDKSANSLIRTTIVPTIIQTGIKDNVIPSLATATVNTRIIPGQSTDEVEAFFRERIKDERVSIKRINQPIEDGPPASVNSLAYKTAEDLIYKVMPDVIPVPFLVSGATDSRYFQTIADGVIKFEPGIDLKGFHGIDERLPVSDLKRMVFFYQLLIKSAH
jgi:carboxypeptidase PM20D1